MDQIALLIAATLASGTPLAIAGLGLLINEKAGVLNLGAEGIMLVAAIAGFAAAFTTGSDTAATAAAHTLASYGVDAGPCGAASLAALEVILTGREHIERRQHLQLAPDSVVVLLVTEGSSSNPVPSS